MNVDLDALEAAAKAATPGLWETIRYRIYADKKNVASAQEVYSYREDEAVLPKEAEANAAYIAAASPTVVLELIAEIRKLRMGTQASAKEHICNNCELHCEYEGEPMTSCLLERVANAGRW